MTVCWYQPACLAQNLDCGVRGGSCSMWIEYDSRCSEFASLHTSVRAPCNLKNGWVTSICAWSIVNPSSMDGGLSFVPSQWHAGTDIQHTCFTHTTKTCATASPCWPCNAVLTNTRSTHAMSDSCTRHRSSLDPTAIAASVSCEHASWQSLL